MWVLDLTHLHGDSTAAVSYLPATDASHINKQVMATRHIRRLQEQLANPAEVESETEGSESGEEIAGPAPFNPFDLLSDDEVSWIHNTELSLPSTVPMHVSLMLCTTANPQSYGTHKSQSNVKMLRPQPAAEACA